MSRTIRKINPTYGQAYDTMQDKKKWWKPSKEFKKLTKSHRKAKERDAISKVITEKTEIIPEFPKTDVWEYL